MTQEKQPPVNAKETLKIRARRAGRPRPLPITGQRIAGRRRASACRMSRYAIEQVWVREIYPFRQLTPLPCTPPFVLGIINVRGQVLPVIDIKKFFDMPETGITDMHSVLIVHVDDMEVGILADLILGVRMIPLASVESSLPTLTGVRAKYLKGVTSEHVVILDAPKILRDPKLVVDQEIEA